MIRAKFIVAAITEHHWGGKEVKLRAMYDDTIPEDRRFAQATPSGNVEMQVDNPAALAELKLGQYFYLDFTPVEVEAVINDAG